MQKFCKLPDILAGIYAFYLNNLENVNKNVKYVKTKLFKGCTFISATLQLQALKLLYLQMSSFDVNRLLWEYL